ncbi:hypothetical protein ABZ943_43085, partial [Streptomyces rubiginosohelvolus]|uniref:hypothetical protein n=1 Tax=Streptomyces rubiginosohelvolus TaxID=67362 RepID=UPI0033D63CAA
MSRTTHVAGSGGRQSSRRRQNDHRTGPADLPREPTHGRNLSLAAADPPPLVYWVTGELFFASSNDLVGRFDYATDPDKVVIDLS